MTDEIGSAIDEVPIETTHEDDETSSNPIPSIVSEGARDGSLALLAGGTVLVGAARSVFRGRFRAVVQLVVGAALVRFGLRQRQRAEATLDERVLGDRLDASELLDEEWADGESESGFSGDESPAGTGDDDEPSDDTETTGDAGSIESTQTGDAEDDEGSGGENR